MIPFHKYFFIIFVFSLVFSADLARSQEPRAQAGVVTKIQGDVETGEDPTRKLAVNEPVYSGDVILTGKDARIQIKMIDGAILTLSGESLFEIEDYLFTPEKSTASYRLIQGAFRAVSGLINGTKDKDFVVKTPVATIGIRGTDFWGGSLDGVYNVALLDGKAIYIQNSAGRVVIDKPGHGTTINRANESPTKPKKWGKSKINRAIATISFK